MNVRRILVGTLTLLGIPSAAVAQSTIFNIPTTDTVSRGKTYFEFDYLPQLPKPDDVDRLSIIVPRVVLGVSETVEVGANLGIVHAADTTSTFVQPNIKWKYANNDQKGLAAAFGGILYAPINNRIGADTIGLVYGAFSKKVKTGNQGPRFTAGPYGVIGASDSFGGPEAGVILGYEQPIHAKVNIVADWLSGKNLFGYFTPGISITLPKNSLFNAGYSIGNDSWENDNATRNRLLFIYYGITF